MDIGVDSIKRPYETTVSVFFLLGTCCDCAIRDTHRQVVIKCEHIVKESIDDIFISTNNNVPYVKIISSG